MADAGAEAKGGSVQEIARALLLWSSDPGGGLCRVQLLDGEARKRVVEKIRAGVAERSIAFSELTLPRDREPEGTALWLARELRALSPGVVSITGFAAAFPPGAKLDRFLQALNYQREQLARPELRQIWWMEAHIGQEFARQIPDLDSWFQIRLSLTEVVPRVEASPEHRGLWAKISSDRQSFDDVSPLEARALLAEAKARVDQAARRGRLEKGARRTLDRALRALRRAGAGDEAAEEERRLKTRYPELWTSSAANPDDLFFTSLSESFGRAERSLLTLLAHLAPEPIPLSMLEENEDLLREAAGGDPRLAESLAALERSSVLSRGGQGEQKTVQLDRRVQSEVLRQIPKKERPLWADLAVRLVLDTAPEGGPSEARNRPAWEMLRPHAARAIDIAEGQKVGEPLAILMNDLGQFLQDKALFAAAEPLLRRALTISEASLGEDHPTLAIYLNNLALLLQDTNRLEEAEPLLRRALTIREASLGGDHPTVAIHLNNLALLLQATNRIEDAQPPLRRALAILESSLGKDHPRTSTVRRNLQRLLQKGG